MRFASPRDAAASLQEDDNDESREL